MTLIGTELSRKNLLLPGVLLNLPSGPQSSSVLPRSRLSSLPTTRWNASSSSWWTGYITCQTAVSVPGSGFLLSAKRLFLPNASWTMLTLIWVTLGMSLRYLLTFRPPNKQKPVKNTRLFGLFHTSDPSLSRDNSHVVEVIVDDLITGLGPSFYTAKT